MTTNPFASTLLALLLLSATTLASSTARVTDSFFSGSAGLAMRFNDTTYSFVQVNSTTALDVSDPMTIEVWIKPRIADKWQTIVSKDGVGTDTTRAFNLYANELTIEFESNNAGSLRSGSVLQVGKWSHVAVVYSSGTCTIYVDSVQVAQSAMVAPQANGRPLLFGRRGFHNKYLSADIDEVRLWNVARSRDDILNRLNERINGTVSGLVGSWNFDSVNGDLIADSSGRGHTAQLMAGQSSGGSTAGQAKPVTVVSDAPLQGSSSLSEDHDVRCALSTTVLSSSGGPFSYRYEIVQLPTRGTLFLAANAVDATRGAAVTAPGLLSSGVSALVYAPNQNENGVQFDSIEFRSVQVAGGGAQSNANNTARFWVSLRPVNDAPVPTSMTYSGTEDHTVAIVLQGVDVDKDVVSTRIETLPANGKLHQSLSGGGLTLGDEITTVPTIVTNNNTVLFVPAPNTHGSPLTQFNFSVYDDFNLTKFTGCGVDTRIGTLSAVQGIATVNVAAVNDAPVVSSSRVRAEQETLLPVDPVGITDVDSTNAQLEITVLSLPTVGSLYRTTSPLGHAVGNELGPDKQRITSVGVRIPLASLFYMPNDGECGIGGDSFTFRAWDGAAESAASASVTFDIYCTPGYRVYSSALVGVLGSLLGVCMALSLVIVVWLYRNRHEPPIQHASFPFCVAIPVGSMLMYACMAMLLTSQPSGFLCTARLWTAVLGFAVMFGTLYLKEWRILKILGKRKRLKVVHIGNRRLWMLWSVYFAIGVLILLIGLYEPPARLLTVDPLNAAVTWVYCSSNVFLDAALAIYVGSAILAGVVVAWKTRRIKSSFDESSHIALSSFNVLFVIITLGPQILTMSNKPQLSFILNYVALLWITLGTIVCIFYPKYNDVVNKTKEFSTTHSTHHPVQYNTSDQQRHSTASQMVKEQIQKQRRSAGSPKTLTPRQRAIRLSQRVGTSNNTTHDSPRRASGSASASASASQQQQKPQQQQQHVDTTKQSTGTESPAISIIADGEESRV